MPDPNDLHAINLQLRAVIEKQNKTIEYLQEQLHLLKHQRFAKDRRVDVPVAQGDLFFNEAEMLAVDGEENLDAQASETLNTETVAVERHTRRGGRRPLPANLPRVEIIHDLPEAEKICPHDGTALHRIGEEIAEQLDIVPAKIQVIRHVRPQYACRCCAQGVTIAPAPPQPIPKSNASPGALAYIATAKYVDGLPLYRLETILARYGVDLPRATSAAWMIRLAVLCLPLMNLLRERIQESDYLHMDETPVQVLKEPDKPPTSTSYVWAIRNGDPAHPLVLFDYDPSRGGHVPKRLLGAFRGALQTDGYDGYNAVVRENTLTHLGCWAHALRKFQDVVKAQKVPKKTGKATHALGLIQRLYRIEREHADATPQQRHHARQQHSIPILNELLTWLNTSLTHVAPKTTLGNALHYLHNEWPKLQRCFDDGRYALDNNSIENTLRPFVIGRKNWLFCDTVHGAQASATLYSLVETAKANGLEPYRYLKYIITALPSATTLEDIEALLPWTTTPESLADSY